MFSSLGWPEIAVLIVVALFIFGPDRLPGATKQAASALKSLKSQLTGARKQIKDEFGDVMPEFDRDLLHPREYIRKHFWEDDETPKVPTATQPRPQVTTAERQPARYDIEAT